VRARTALDLAGHMATETLAWVLEVTVRSLRVF
jgi:hypothetical protein